MLKIKENNYAFKNYKFFILLICLSCVFAAMPGTAAAQTTEFTYQGRLTDNNGTALTGNYDFEFRLFDASNNLLGTQTRLGVAVSNGAFTTTLDFGSSPQQFTGAARLLQISVRTAGIGFYTNLMPRQPITSAPYSIRSREATTADAAINAAQLGGVPAAQFVQTDVNGNASIGGNLSIGGTLMQPIVNAATEYQIGGQRVLKTDANDNTFVGLFAGQSTSTGVGNSFFGFETGFSNLTGTNNSFFGSNAGRNNTASGNSFFGQSAGFTNTTGVRNSFFGLEAGFSNTEGVSNSFFGNTAGGNNTTGGQNSFFGFAAGNDNTTGNSNAFFGSSAGSRNTTAGSNSFFGAGAGAFNLTGIQNTFIGGNSGFNNLSGGSNIFVGMSSGFQNTTGNSNVFIGVSAGAMNTTGLANTVVGTGANLGANNLNFASAFGSGAIVNSSNTVVLGRTLDTVQIPGNLNLAGSFTGNFTVPATNITGVLGAANGGTNLSSSGASGNFLRSNGTNWMSSPIQPSDLPNLSGSFIQNQIVQQTGNFNINGTGTADILNAVTQFNLGGQPIIRANPNNSGFNGASLSVGIETGQPVAGAGNAFFGYRAGKDNTAGVNNSFFGNQSGINNTTGDANTFTGFRAGFNNVAGEGNAFYGTGAGGGIVSGSGNSYFGNNAGNILTDGDNNTFVGSFSSAGIIKGDVSNNNTLLGAETTVDGSFSFATAIGAGSLVNANNTIALGRTNGLDTVRIYGNLVVNGTINGNPIAKQNNALQLTVEKQQIQIQSQQAQIQKQNANIEAQQKQIEALQKLVCLSNPNVEICQEK